MFFSAIHTFLNFNYQLICTFLRHYFFNRIGSLEYEVG